VHQGTEDHLPTQTAFHLLPETLRVFFAIAVPGNNLLLCERLARALVRADRFVDAIPALVCAAHTSGVERQVALIKLGFIYEISGKTREAQDSYHQAYLALAKDAKYSCTSKTGFNLRNCGFVSKKKVP
jgi:hypothetical protein